MFNDVLVCCLQGLSYFCYPINSGLPNIMADKHTSYNSTDSDGRMALPQGIAWPYLVQLHQPFIQICTLVTLS